MIYYHVANPLWAQGQPLRSRNDLLADGINIPWLWEEAPDGTDCDVVCLFDKREEAEWMHDDRPGYLLLQIDVPPNTKMGRAEWEFFATLPEVPAEWITVIS